MPKSSTRISTDYITVCVKKSIHEKVKFYLKNESSVGGFIGTFYDIAASEKLDKLKKEKTKSK